MDTRIDGRWYAPLLQPVLPTVDAAVRELDARDDPWGLPRTGLGGAMVIHVAKGFGVRRWPRAGRVAVMALEGYNQRVHVGAPDTGERARWLERDIDFARRAWQSALEKDDPILRRVMDRLLGEGAELCDRTIPEAVLFLRAAVAAGVLVGDVPDPIHAALDRHATWLGLSWEANRGALGPDAWDGALRAVGLREPYPSDPDRVAREQAGGALRQLESGPVVRLLNDVLARAPRETPAHDRAPRTWEPLIAPAPNGAGPRARPDGAFGTFSATWAPDVEGALVSLAASESRSLGRATEYLLGQGGKRVRPMVALAAAEACGGAPRRILPIAASVEWLHQASLVLDDIIDESSLRRGAPPLHAATSQPFAAGVAAFLFAKVLRALHGMHPDLRNQLVGAATALAMGERLELEKTGDPTLSLTTYYQIIEGKTARVFRCAATVGALGAEAPREQVKALGRYGHELGLAFQIVDDLLDYTGEAETLGKRPGTDLRAAKMTLPLIALRDWLDPGERSRLDRALGGDEALSWVLERLAEHRVLPWCRERAQRHAARAVEALAALPASTGRAVLEDLAQRMVGRTC